MYLAFDISHKEKLPESLNIAKSMVLKMNRSEKAHLELAMFLCWQQQTL